MNSVARVNHVKATRLYVYDGNFGLPSVDPKCLLLMFYLKLHPTNQIIVMPNKVYPIHNLPVLEYKGRVYTDFTEIVTLFDRLIGNEIDPSFTDDDKYYVTNTKRMNFACMAVVSFLNSWGLRDNAFYSIDIYTINVHPFIRKTFIYSLMGFVITAVDGILENRSILDTIDQQNEMLEHYFGFLSNRLKYRKYLMGIRPTTLDAHVCAYLGPLLRLDYPNRLVQDVLLRQEILCNYVDNFLILYGDEVLIRDIPRYKRAKQTRANNTHVFIVMFIGFFLMFIMHFFGIMEPW